MSLYLLLFLQFFKEWKEHYHHNGVIFWCSLKFVTFQIQIWMSNTIALHSINEISKIAVQMGVSAEVEGRTISFGKGGDNKENECSAVGVLQVEIPTCFAVICLDNTVETHFSFCYPGSNLPKIRDGDKEKLSFR